MPKMANQVTATVWGFLIVLSVVGCSDSADTQGGNPFNDVHAVDGTNVAACADGNCEIEVSGPVDIPLNGHGDVTTLSVTTVDSGGIGFTTVSDGDQTGSGDLEPNCTLTLHRGGGGSSCGGVQSAPARQTGVLAMQLFPITDGRFVLRLTSGEVGSPPNSLVPRIPHIPNVPVVPPIPRLPSGG